MLYLKNIQVEPIIGEGGIRCQRCGRALTNPKSIERGYGPVCWQKIEVELWLGVVVDSDVQMPPAPPVIQRTLDEFLFVEVESQLAESPIHRAILVEV